MRREGGATYVPKVAGDQQDEWIIRHMDIANAEDAVVEGAVRLKQFKGLPVPEYYTCGTCRSVV